MKVQIKTIGIQIKREFEKAIKKQHLQAGERLANIFTAEAKTLLQQTTKNAINEGESALKNSIPHETRKIKIMPDGVLIKVNIRMVGLDGKPHFIWHLLNKGREDGPAKSDLWFPIRNSTRTTVGSLSVKPFSGYSGKYRRIPKGKFIGGFLGREWYRTTMFMLKKNYMNSKITYKD